MNRESFEKYELSPEKEKNLWNDSIVVFDTSALIDFYYYPKETRQEIFDKIFLKLKDRLWIPYHVQFEYLKNRKGIIEKPIVENYNPIKNEKIKDITSAKTKILKVSEQIKKDTLKPEKHPFLPQEKIDEFIEFTKELDARVQQFEKDLTEEIAKQETEIKSLNENDTILKAFEDNLNVGPELSHSEIMRIVAEGKLRYEFEIPPGYKDLKEKIGTQIFGDLIVWKQILNYAKDIDKSVIFICNDLKIDWCYKDSRNRIESPREELIKEFNDNNQKDFWMYNQSQFVYKAKEYLEVDIEDARIEEISNVISNRNNDALIYKCGFCHQRNEVPIEELYLEFDCVGGSERSMGAENQYQSEEPLECSFCGNDINVTLEIWEYPIGAHNLDDITIDNGEVIQSPDFVTHFWDNYYDEPDEDMFRER
ncbi:PIN-like domain-containing protein [Mesonia ostreae]|uniref:PIN-like domain-containing protein n=1 Tax=Mesonia ostreae TaxID=861110 RepID=A0ABU2KGY6_9FLAO|nr:PIN-like domain-containing protein [Mesonia ostreae]MDT0293973.1 PIN-like domain-containing protein [Mesonia ostreae]